jgi:DNA-binding GntR family transcriptional regulator
LTGQFSPGARLAEEHLAAAMRVSRTPVREALHRLEAEGMVARCGRRGFAVPPSSAAVRDELLELKAVLEGYVLRTLCAHVTSAVFAALRDTVQRSEAAVAFGEPRIAARWNGRFHAYLIECVATRPRLAAELVALAQQLIRYRTPAGWSEDASSRRAAQHRKLLVALELGDADLCERLTRQHGAGAQSLACVDGVVLQGALAPWYEDGGRPTRGWNDAAASRGRFERGRLHP